MLVTKSCACVAMEFFKFYHNDDANRFFKEDAQSVEIDKWWHAGCDACVQSGAVSAIKCMFVVFFYFKPML